MINRNTIDYIFYKYIDYIFYFLVGGYPNQKIKYIINGIITPVLFITQTTSGIKKERKKTHKNRKRTDG